MDEKQNLRSELVTVKQTLKTSEEDQEEMRSQLAFEALNKANATQPRDQEEISKLKQRITELNSKLKKTVSKEKELSKTVSTFKEIEKEKNLRLPSWRQMFCPMKTP